MSDLERFERLEQRVRTLEIDMARIADKMDRTKERLLAAEQACERADGRLSTLEKADEIASEVAKRIGAKRGREWGLAEKAVAAAAAIAVIASAVHSWL